MLYSNIRRKKQYLIKRNVVSEFAGKQVNIFDEFGFDIPNGSRSVKSKPKSKPKNNEKKGLRVCSKIDCKIQKERTWLTLHEK